MATSNGKFSSWKRQRLGGEPVFPDHSQRSVWSERMRGCGVVVDQDTATGQLRLRPGWARLASVGAMGTVEWKVEPVALRASHSCRPTFPPAVAHRQPQLSAL
jgi:hypothetical protein